MKAFIIHLPEREHSVQHANYMFETLKSYNIDAELFKGTPGDEAVELAAKAEKTLYPYSIKNKIIDVDDITDYVKPDLKHEFLKKYFFRIFERQLIGVKDQGKLSRPGVIGCFYSHYSLWKKCIDLDEPIMIFEDDVKFYRGFEKIDWDDILILSLGKSSFYEDPWKTYLENPSGNPQPITWRNFSMPGASGYAIKPHAAWALVKFYKSYWYPADNAINQFICRLQATNYIMGRNKLDEEGNISMTKSKEWQ